jgi:chromate transporter
MVATSPQIATVDAVPFATALRFWCKLGFISFGGPAGQIAIMHRELVEERGWISEERFLHALNFCMLLPGPEAQQLATYIGWLKHGVRGGIAAGVLFVLPGFLLLTIISALYASLRDFTPVQGILFGLKAAVIAVVFEALLRIAKRALERRLHWLIAGAAFLAIFAFGVPFPIIILLAGLLGWIGAGGLAGTQTASNVPLAATPLAHSWSHSLKIALVCCILWALPILVMGAMLGPEHVLTLQGLFFSKMAVVTFGGAYAVLAYVAQEAVTRFGWLSTDDMLQGLALAESTPGPLILVLTFVGFIGAYQDPAPFSPLLGGLLGALITTWVTFVPCFLWILVGAPYVERLRQQQALASALASITAAVVGVILNLALWFTLHALFREVPTLDLGPLHLPTPRLASFDAPAIVIAGLALLALLRFKLPMFAVLGLSALAGLLIEVV